MATMSSSSNSSEQRSSNTLRVQEMGAHHGNAVIEAFRVASRSVSGAYHVVTHYLVSDRYACGCPAAQYGHHDCAHVRAVEDFVEQRRAAAVGYEMLYGEYTQW